MKSAITSYLIGFLCIIPFWDFAAAQITRCSDLGVGIARWGQCSTTEGSLRCCDKTYCQPWNSGYSQCIPIPEKCPLQEPDFDYYGNDIGTFRGLHPSECCEKCSQTNNCAGYTFVNQNPDGVTVCYLKHTMANKVKKVGAVSGTLSKLGCSNTIWSPCGNESIGAKCCPANSFCQPWNSGYYQCIPTPDPVKCPTIVTGVDYYQHDIETRYGLLPDTCCEACYNHPDCHLFTFVNENPDGRSACYLKFAMGPYQPKKASAISGITSN